MQPATASASLPENFSPQQIGAELARLRAQYGLSQQEVSDRLHIRARYITAMEEGKFDLIPGKVYARGYLQTYAEFLGLKPEQIVNQCFAGEGSISSITVHHPTSAFRADVPTPGFQHFRKPALLVAALVLAALGIGQLTGTSTPEEPPANNTPAQVPEEMLESMRTMVMPTPGNKECLVSDLWFACPRADADTRALDALNARTFWVLGDVDVSEVELPEPEASSTPARATAEESPSAEETTPAETAESIEPAND